MHERVCVCVRSPLNPHPPTPLTTVMGAADPTLLLNVHHSSYPVTSVGAVRLHSCPAPHSPLLLTSLRAVCPHT